MGRASGKKVVTCVIYAIVHVPTGIRYIGMSCRGLRVRQREHESLLRRREHTCAALQLAWNTDGEGAFLFSILEAMPKTTTPVQLRQRETAWRHLLATVLFNPPTCTSAPEYLGLLATPEFASTFVRALFDNRASLLIALLQSYHSHTIGDAPRKTLVSLPADLQGLPVRGRFQVAVCDDSWSHRAMLCPTCFDTCVKVLPPSCAPRPRSLRTILIDAQRLGANRCYCAGCGWRGTVRKARDTGAEWQRLAEMVVRQPSHR